MSRHEIHELRNLHDTPGERRSVALLTITMATGFIAFFVANALATPVFPPDVLHALVSLPSFSNAL